MPFIKGGNRGTRAAICPCHTARKWQSQDSRQALWPQSQCLQSRALLPLLFKGFPNIQRHMGPFHSPAMILFREERVHSAEGTSETLTARLSLAKDCSTEKRRALNFCEPQGPHLFSEEIIYLSWGWLTVCLTHRGWPRHVSPLLEYYIPKYIQVCSYWGVLSSWKIHSWFL